MMLVRVESQYAVSIAYQRFFKHSTIAFLAQEIEAATLVKSVVKTEDVNKKNSITI